MKLLILSDSHGYSFFLEEILKRERGADMIIHLGDGGDDMMIMSEYTQGKMVYICKGNCDSAVYGFPEAVQTEAEGVTIFACHGHQYGVKFGLQKLYYAARERSAQLCLFGHTHEPLCDFEEDFTMVNPGPAASGYYAVAELKNGKVKTVNKQIK